MSPILDAFLRSWPFDPWLLTSLLLTAAIYVRGWMHLRGRGARHWSSGQLAAFLGGLAAIFLALGSPIEPFSALFLQVHMLQHLLLMMVAPPLLWLGTPMFPLLRGIPRPIRVYWIGPFFRSVRLRHFFTRLTHPFMALPLFVGATWFWHIPALYEIALRSPGWHYLQHVCFLATALLFWYPVVQPYPSRPNWPAWLIFPYLIFADVQNTVLSALLTFSDKVLYPYYEQIPRVGGLSALEDQAAAGVIMWVPGSLAFLLPLFWIGIRVLYGPTHDNLTRRREDKRKTSAFPAARMSPGERQRLISPRPGTPGRGAGGEGPSPGIVRPPHPRPLSPEAGARGDHYLPFALPLVASTRQPASSSSAHAAILSSSHPVTSSPFDALRLPLLGRFLRWRHARMSLQVPLLLLAAVVIVDGLRGPQVGAMNLAGVLPWIHWRGFVILGLLAAGNLFCMACPFTLPRSLARRLLESAFGIRISRFEWPRRLRSKWLAVLLLVVFLWAYEAFALWDSPWWTAWIALGYFVMAFVVDVCFRGAAFCKYVCPIGQFNFVQSLVSPLEVKVRDPGICVSCQTKDCIRGGDGIPGCESGLFQPHKVGNMDCTFCLDCVHACPHENVGILARVPARELWHDTFRSGVGRFGKRPDLASLIVVLVFGAFANAAGMVGPVLEWQDRFRMRIGVQAPLYSITLLYALFLVVLPMLMVGTAAVVSRIWGKATTSTMSVATRFAYALVPMGFCMWLSHYSFHFLTSYETVIPAAQRFAADLGGALFGEPEWACSCCRPAAEWLPRLQILFLDSGLLLSLYSGYRIALSQSPNLAQALKLFAPWIALISLLFVAGIWITFQPMQMRGTMGG